MPTSLAILLRPVVLAHQQFLFTAVSKDLSHFFRTFRCQASYLYKDLNPRWNWPRRRQVRLNYLYQMTENNAPMLAALAPLRAAVKEQGKLARYLKCDR